MPIPSGEYADILRGLGRFLDEVGARDIEITDHGAFLSLAWRGGRGGTDQRYCQDQDLDRLRLDARQARGQTPHDVRGGFAELLRTLGQDLDRWQADFNHIVQQSDGFEFSGTLAARYTRHHFLMSDLVASSRRRRECRGGSQKGVLRFQGIPAAAQYSQAANAGPLSRRLAGAGHA